MKQKAGWIFHPFISIRLNLSNYSVLLSRGRINLPHLSAAW